MAKSIVNGAQLYYELTGSGERPSCWCTDRGYPTIPGRRSSHFWMIRSGFSLMTAVGIATARRRADRVASARTSPILQL